MLLIDALMKEQVLSLYNNGLSMSEIGRMLHISRQRVHQLVRGYKNSGNQRLNRKQLLFLVKKKACDLCGSISANIHHKDYNNSNDEIGNLQPLCKKCHYMVHTNRYSGKWARMYSCCRSCKSTDIPHKSKGYCVSCYFILKQGVRVNTKREQFENCVRCNASFLTKKYKSKGRCNGCYSVYRYSISETHRENHKKYNKDKYYRLKATPQPFL